MFQPGPNDALSQSMKLRLLMASENSNRQTHKVHTGSSSCSPEFPILSFFSLFFKFFLSLFYPFFSSSPLSFILFLFLIFPHSVIRFSFSPFFKWCFSSFSHQNWQFLPECPHFFLFFSSFVFGPILDDRLKEKLLKPWKGALSSHSVCPCVCERATGHTFWPRNLIFGLSDP